MNTYRQVMRQVGIVLIVVGALDIGLMIYCIATHQSYSSSLNIFAVAAGIALIRGNLKVARGITWLCAVLLGVAIAAPVLSLARPIPPDLIATEFRLQPIAWTLTLIWFLAQIVLLTWVYRRLRSPDVVRAQSEAGQPSYPPYRGFAMGVFLVVGITVLAHFTREGMNEERAVELAKSRTGPGFKYYVTRLGRNGSNAYATVTAYNDHEVRDVRVQWQP